MDVHVFVDGAAFPNPGRGAYAAIVRVGDTERVIVQGYQLTTNNRMELRGVIAALESLEHPSRVRVVSDSTYVVLGIGWTKKWRARGWRKSDGKDVLNVDLWQRLVRVCRDHNVEFEWTRGHSGHTENERCDVLAAKCALEGDLILDEGYRGSGGSCNVSASGAAYMASWLALAHPGCTRRRASWSLRRAHLICLMASTPWGCEGAARRTKTT